MFLKRMFPFFLLTVLVVAGCSQDESDLGPPDPNVVAAFNGGVITKAQVTAKYESLMPCCKDRYQGEEGRRALIKEMVLPAVISKAIKYKKNTDILKVRISDEELKDFYYRHKQGLHGDEYEVPERVRIQEIIIESAEKKQDCPTCPKENKRPAREKADARISWMGTSVAGPVRVPHP